MPEILPDQRVVWFRKTKRGRTIGVTKHTGTVVCVNGSQTVVREDWNKRRVKVALKDLSPLSQDTKLSIEVPDVDCM